MFGFGIRDKKRDIISEYSYIVILIICCTNSKIDEIKKTGLGKNKKQMVHLATLVIIKYIYIKLLKITEV